MSVAIPPNADMFAAPLASSRRDVSMSPYGMNRWRRPIASLAPSTVGILHDGEKDTEPEGEVNSWLGVNYGLATERMKALKPSSVIGAPTF